MTPALIHGDHVSCSRVGGSMRRESSRLRQHARSLDDALGELAGWIGPEAEPARAAIAATIRALRAIADDLDEAGAALQGYATELAEDHELGRRAEQRVEDAGLLLDGSRVVEPWGSAHAAEADRRRAQVLVVQARVDFATAGVGRARGRLGREMRRLAQAFSEHSRAADPVWQTPLPPR